jgi:hypothetical protein
MNRILQHFPLLNCNQRIGFRFAAVAVNTAARGSAVIPCPRAASPTCPSTTTSRSRRPWRRVDTTTCGRHRQTVGDADGHEQPGQQGVSIQGLRVKCAQGVSGILPIARTKTGGAGANTREKHPRESHAKSGHCMRLSGGFPVSAVSSGGFPVYEATSSQPRPFPVHSVQWATIAPAEFLHAFVGGKLAGIVVGVGIGTRSMSKGERTTTLVYGRAHLILPS